MLGKKYLDRISREMRQILESREGDHAISDIMRLPFEEKKYGLRLEHFLVYAIRAFTALIHDLGNMAGYGSTD